MGDDVVGPLGVLGPGVRRLGGDLVVLDERGLRQFTTAHRFQRLPHRFAGRELLGDPERSMLLLRHATGIRAITRSDRLRDALLESVGPDPDPARRNYAGPADE